MIAQIALVILGAGAIFLLAQKRGRVRRWGYIVGLLSEPFWVYSSLTAHQWGVVALTAWWAGFYAIGAVNNWRVE